MDYRIPMNRLSVRLRLADGGEKAADVFLHTASGMRDGVETMDEFLNSTRAFIPCLLSETSDPFLCNKETIVLVGGITEPAYVDRSDAEPTATHRVRIRLAGDHRIEGNLRVFLPAEGCRVSDFLNSAEGFFPVHGDDGVSYVHRRYVEEVVPVQESPR